MATYKARGPSHCVIYTFKTGERKYKQQWETYDTELEAIQRKAYIELLQKSKRYDELIQAAAVYREKNEERNRTAAEADAVMASSVESKSSNIKKTYREFAEVWLPLHARKMRFSPNSYDSYMSNLKVHILPYFGDRVMSTISAEDIDGFVDYLSQKPCKGTKSYNKELEDIPTLASSTVKKCYMILTSGFAMAKKWGYVKSIPETTAPSEKYKKRNAWEPEQVLAALAEIKEDKLLHLAVHIAFACSLRAGETAGVDIGTIDFYDRSLWIKQEVQRVSDEALEELPKNEIIRVFPKQLSTAKSSLILKAPKTDGSVRKIYLTSPLLHEINERLAQIRKHKERLGSAYNDYGLLLCKPDGSPIDPKNLVKLFKEWQDSKNIEDQIEFQGLRKSGQMHKVRITNNDYQLVAANGGHTAPVLMTHYNEARDKEKRKLAQLVENDFYSLGAAENQPVKAKVPAIAAQDILAAMQNDPQLYQRVLQEMLLNAATVNTVAKKVY